MTLTTLEVENRTEPLGIDVAAPRFSWVTKSDARDVLQSSYRLRVATSEAALESADVWDSGTVTSNESTGIEFGGPALAAATDYVWRVDIETSAGTAHATSSFSTGLLTDDDWAGAAWIGRERAAQEEQLTFDGASWIWTPEQGAPYAPAEPRAFRKVIDAPTGKSATSAEIVLTADDSYELWVNGEPIGKTAGAENEWQGSKRYVVDLAANQNTFAVRTTNGPNSPAGLLLVARVSYDDGTTETLTTDAAWKAVKTIPAGFEAVGFDDASWPAAAVQAAYGSGPWGTGVNPPSSTPAPAPLLRKEFQVTGPIESAKVYVAAGGYADVSLNGAPINDEILSPGYTDYDDHAQYTVTDLADQLQPGANALGMVLGRGFYGMTNGNVWNWQNAPWHDDPVARAVLRIVYADGTVDDITTDDSWNLDDSATQLDDLYGGENYDARLEQPGYDTVGFDDDGWSAASEVAGPKGTLMNQQQQPIRITERLAAESITEPVDGVYVVKFPRVLAGTVEITAEGAAGATINAQYGEKLLDNGRPNFSNNGGFQNGFQIDHLTLAGTDEPETWAARFSYKGFQYIEVTGWPGDEAPPLDAFTALDLHTDAPETGSFESSDDIMNRTHRAVVDTLLNNLHGIPTDTPMFEKNGWTGDAAVGAEMFLMNLDTQNLFEKWIGDINDTRDADGAPLVIAPSSGDWGQWGVAPPWHSAFILIPWWLYQYGGDTQVLARYYDSMKTYVDLEFSRSPGGVVPENRLGDWVSPEASPGGGNAPEDARVSGTAYLYTMLTSMEKTAKLLGKTTDTAAFAAQSAVVKDGFNAEFLDTASGSYRGVGDVGYRQTHNVLALAFGLAPDAEMADRVAASVAADVVAKGNKLNTGSLGSKYLLPVLTDYGYEQLAYEVAVQKEYPSWGYMIENGATSMWEHWSLEARSRGHYFLGTVDDWFYHYAAGIKGSETTGYRDITIAPAVTEQLDWAKATTQTPYGPVSVDWKKTDGVLSLESHVPVGSTAVVKLPAANSWAVTENGTPLDEVDGVRDVSHDGTDVLVTVGSGDYSFEVNDTAGSVGSILDRLGELQGQADSDLANAALTADQHAALAELIILVRAHVSDALALAASGDAGGAATGLAAALRDVGGIDEYLASLSEAGVTEATVTRLVTLSDAVRTAIDETISGLLGVQGSAVLDATAYQPGVAGVASVRLSNTGTTELGAVTAALTGLDETWQPAPSTPVADDVPPAGQVSANLGFTVPAGQLPGAVPAGAELTYIFSGAEVRLTVPFDIVVDSPVVITELGFDPATVAPGEASSLIAVVQNTGTAPVAGHLKVTVPDGWTAPLPTAEVVIAPMESATISVPVFVPTGANQQQVNVTIGAAFESAGVTFASGTADLGVLLAPVPDPNVGYDHADLGESASEQAHGLTASDSSGTNTEAGLTRRYAGHLTDFSFFEFDMDVVPGQPFVIRSTETYDRAQTKRYKVYVDGTEVQLRQFTHNGGVGTETYEFAVDAALATDDSVRVKFENLDDHGFYDPSIADVWTLAAADDSAAPQLVLNSDPATPDRVTGWYTASPVVVSTETLDDRDGDVLVEARVDDGAWAELTEPISLADDGVHEVHARATDAAGNVSAEQQLTIRIDTVVPETSAALGDEFEGGSADNRGTVEFTATDATSGVDSTRYRVNDGEWQLGGSAPIEEEGDFTLEYYSTDVAGNVEATQSISGTIVIPDVTAPSVTASVSNAGENGWHLAGAELTLSASDAESGVANVEYRLGDGGWTGYSSPVAMPEGQTTVSYRAADVDGNVSDVGSLAVSVDATTPELWGWLSDAGRVSAVANDVVTDGAPSSAASGIGSVEYSLDGSTWVMGLSQLISSEATPDSLRARATDKAGNRGETVLLERTSMPDALTVTSGARLLVEASGFEAGQEVRVELHSDPVVLATVAADAAGVISTIAQVPADFPSGEHRLVLAVDDGDGGDGDGDGNGGGDGNGNGGGSVEIPVGVIASTGFDALPLAALAALLLLGGAWVGLRRGPWRKRGKIESTSI